MKPIMILGTSAPHRRAMATKHFGTVYDIVSLSPNIDEKSVRAETASALTHSVADAKMDAILAAVEADDSLSSRVASRPGSVAVTFDQVVVFDDEEQQPQQHLQEVEEEEGSAAADAALVQTLDDGATGMHHKHGDLSSSAGVHGVHDVDVARRVGAMQAIREKPASPEEALFFIMSYACRSVYTVQCTVLYCFDSAIRSHAENTTATRYGDGLTADVAARMVSRGTCLHTAGALVVEDADMQACMKQIYMGTEEEVRGFSARTLHALLGQS